MIASLAAVRSLLLAIFVMMAGSGFLATLISLRLERAGVAAPMIGLVGTAYFAGLMVGSLRVAPLISRIGHIRAFAAFISIFSASSLTYAVHHDVALWSVLRFIDGFVVSGVFVCLESWLNERSEERSRSTTLAGYMIFLYSGQAVGQLLLNLSDTKPSLPFMVAAILLSLAALPVVLTHIQQPVIGELKRLSLKQLYRVSPLGLVGAALTGAMLAAFYALGAVYAQRLGLELSEIAWFTGSVILGGVLFQWPLGRLSDRFDRRRVIVGCAAGTGLTAVGLTLIGGNGVAMLALGSLFGGLSFALYPLCVAHANDHIGKDERVAASGGLVLAYSLGAVTGPLAGSLVMALWQASGLFLFIALCALAFTCFGFWRQWAAAPVPSDEQQSWQILPRTTPMAAVLAEGGDETKD